MSIEKVRAYFAQFGMEKRILEFDVSSATVELAAQAVGVLGVGPVVGVEGNDQRVFTGHR